MRTLTTIPAAFAASVLLAAGCQPASSPTAVTLVETPDTIQLGNGVIAMAIERSTGRTTSLRRTDGPDVFGRDRRNISFDSNGSGPAPNPRRAGYRGTGPRDYRVVHRSGDLVDVAFASPADDVFPFETDWHYVLRAGDSGVYVYVIFRRSADAAPGGLGQTRIVMRLREELFTHYFVSDRITGQYPKLTDPSAKPTLVTDATVMFPDGRIATKYNLADFEEDHHVHGVAGGEGGVWVISASNEYVNGGPTKQDLHVHEDAVIVLKMLHSGHFLMGGGLSFEQGEPWTKFYGPFLIYLNRAESPAAAWADAKARAAVEQAAWPYAWVDNPDYPLYRTEVTGRLTIQGQAPAANACVILAPLGPDANQDWQTHGKGYMYWTRTAQDGSFVIRNVRPGMPPYLMHAFVPGYAGDLGLYPVLAPGLFEGLRRTWGKEGSVATGRETIDIGTVEFVPLTHGRQLWQIGTPDRSAGEFRYGDQPRQFGLWNRYLADFPNDVTFRIGQSRERTDWNYCQPVVQKPDGSWHKPTWRVLFDLPAAQTGQATLTIGVAGAARKPTLVLSANDTEIARSELANDGSVYRDANQAGFYRLWTIPFDAALLKQGRNVLTLEMLKSDPSPPQPYNPLSLPRAAIMYDFLRLEVAP